MISIKPSLNGTLLPSLPESTGVKLGRVLRSALSARVTIDTRRKPGSLAKKTAFWDEPVIPSALPDSKLAFKKPVILRVLLVDDSAVFLQAVAELVASLPGVEIVGEATSGAEALELAAALHPDLVLTDLAMPWMNGLQVARCLMARPFPPRIIIMTADDEQMYRAAAEEAGADACLVKSALSHTLAPLLNRMFRE